MRLAIALVVALVLAGAAMIIAGIQMIAGTPWALIASGVGLLGAGFLLRTGLINDG